MVKPIVTIASFVLGGLALAFAAYVQANPTALRAGQAAAVATGTPQKVALGATPTASDGDGDSKRAKNEVFVVMIEPMFFMGVMDPETVGDAPLITPSRTEPVPAQSNQWILSAHGLAHGLRSARAPCVK